MNDYDKKYLTKFNVFSFSASGFGQNLIIGVVNSFILYFYTDIFLIPASAVTALMFSARVFDALNDPVMGNIVDKTRTKYGKLRPYLIATVLPLAIITSLLFLSPDFSLKGKIVYAYITYFAFGIIYTVCDVPFWGMASAMTPNPKERIWFISFSRLFHSIGGALPIVIVPLFVKLAGDNIKAGYSIAGIVIGCVGAALFSLAFFGTKERCNLDEKKPSLKENFKFFLINKPLQIVVISNVLGFARAMAIVASLYIATYLLNNQDMNMFILGAWGVAGYIGMIITPKLASKFNYRQMYLLSAGIAITALLALYFIGYNKWSVCICLAVAGLPYGIVTNINYAMIADSVDYVEWKTGKRTEGISISFQTLMNKLMTALQVTAVSWILVLIAFVQPVEINKEIIIQHQSEKTLNGMFMMITILPVIGWILSVIPMQFYDFTGEKRKTAHMEIIRKREEAGI
ncbi:MAG: MFS transporter [Christensenellales bacterium]|jgi:sugar (glycoside-pentoside-hexuronide) transporter